MSNHPRADLYMKDREEGLTYQEIADKHGVTHQAVAQSLTRRCAGGFKPYTKKSCVYPNLRRWLNENKVCKNEFVRRMGLAVSGTNSQRISDYFRGKCYPSKKAIDKMLQVTGLTYEELFTREEDDHGQE